MYVYEFQFFFLTLIFFKKIQSKYFCLSSVNFQGVDDIVLFVLN